MSDIKTATVNDKIPMFGFAYVKFDKNMLSNKTIDNKLFLVLCFLRINATRSGKVITSLNYLIERIGFKPNSHKNQINSKITLLLKYLICEEYISINCDIDKIKPKELFEIQINIENNIFDVDDNFVSISENEFNCIIQSTTSYSKDTLLKVFLSIKSFICNSAGCAKIAYPALRSIRRLCNLNSDSTIDSAIDELKDIGILYKYGTGSYFSEEKQKKQNAINVYALSQEELDSIDCEQVVKDYYANFGVHIDHFDPITKPNTKEKKSNSIVDANDDNISEEQKQKDLESIMDNIPDDNSVFVQENDISSDCEDSPNDLESIDISEIVEDESENTEDNPREIKIPFGDFYTNVAVEKPVEFHTQDVNYVPKDNKDDLSWLDEECDDDTPKETEAERKKRITDVWGFDPDVPESLRLTKKILNDKNRNSQFAVDEDDLY